MNGISSVMNFLGLRLVVLVCGGAGMLLLASCAPKVDTDAASKELTRLDDAWSKAAATRNADTVAAFYAPDAIAYPSNEPAAVGQAAAKQVWARYFADSTFSISWKTVHAGVAKCGDLGFTAGTYEDSFRGPTGKSVTEMGKYVCTWAKQPDGSWKAIHDIWNTDTR
jgi:ketosteroid isomerase-like protein